MLYSCSHRKSFTLLSLFTLVSCFAYSQVAVYPEQTNREHHDTLMMWHNKLQFDQDSKTWYGVYQDSSAIHIQLVTTDALQQRKIVINGLELWIDLKGKKNKTTGITYPMGSTDRKSTDFQNLPLNAGRAPDTSTATAAFLKPLINRQKQIKLTGFTKAFNGTRETNTPGGPLVSLYFINDTLHYDAAIPFRLFVRPVDQHSTLSIGIIEKGFLPFGMDNDMGGGPGGEGGPPPGGMGGGGMPQGPPPGEEMGPNGNGLENMMQNNVIWYKLILQ